VPEIQVGDTVDVHFWIELGEKGRTQVFNGTVIAIKGEKPDEFVTVRRIVQGEGVERIFPLLSPRISKIEVKKTGHVRRAKLYYLRKRVGKATRLKERKKGEAETTSKAQKAEKAAAKELPRAAASGTLGSGGQKPTASRFPGAKRVTTRLQSIPGLAALVRPPVRARRGEIPPTAPFAHPRDEPRRPPRRDRRARPRRADAGDRRGPVERDEDVRRAGRDGRLRQAAAGGGRDAAGPAGAGSGGRRGAGP